MNVTEMSLDEKIGQLFVVPLCPKRGQDHIDDWTLLIDKYHIGGVMLKHSDPISQVKILNALQSRSKIPLLVAADAEWGLAMRMSDVITYPKNMTLGAIEDIDLIHQLGLEIGRQAKLVGVHLNLAPVADVNSNPNNPVIGMRSFGEDPKRVAQCVSAYASGLEEAGVMACAKHFPGHGDTTVDSHKDLPIVEHIELIPFKQAVDGGISALMTAHLYVPAVDSIYPTSLSVPCIQLARKTLGFDGLIVSDALNMKAVADRYGPEEVALLARKADCDLLLYGTHINELVDEIIRSTIPKAFRALKEAYMSEKLDLKELDRTVARILEKKKNIKAVLPLEGLMEALHTKEAIDLKKKLFEEAITLVGADVFPIPENSRYLSFGDGDILANEFVGNGEKVVVAIYQKEALTEEALAKIDSLGDRAIVCLFTTPYVLKSLKNQKTILVGYENDPDAQRAVLQVLKGNLKAKGHLPIIPK